MSGPELGGNGGGSDPAPQPQTPPPPPAPPAAHPGESVGAAASQASAAASQASAAAGQAASAAAAAMEGMFGSITMAEQFMVAGALLVLVLGELLFGALLGGGGNFIAAVLASAELLLAVWLRNRRTIQWPASYGLILSALVLAVAVPVLDGFLFFLHSVTQPGFNVGGPSGLLADLSNWAGAVLMSWGAILYWRTGGK